LENAGLRDGTVLESHFASDPTSQFSVRLGPWQNLYHISFCTGMQTNVTTGTSRALRRHSDPRKWSKQMYYDDCKLPHAREASLETKPKQICDCATSQCTLKITFDGDLRRSLAVWYSSSENTTIFEAIEDAVLKTFPALRSQEKIIRYNDEDGDLCTLVIETVDDFVSLATTRGIMKVVVEALPHSGATNCHTENCVSSDAHDLLKDCQGVSIATPPPTPKKLGSKGTVISDEHDEDFVWSIVEPSSQFENNSS